jgi:hypothetical protein
VPVALWALPGVAFAQGDGPRMYWKTLTDANAITFMPMHMTGNANPLDPAHVQPPDGSFEANVALVGYSRTLDFFGRSSLASALLPVGNLQGEVSGLPLDQQQSASGFGDLTLQFDVNLFGAPAMKDLQSLLRYEPKFTIDVLGSVTLPVGEYDSDSLINLGQNRWYGRIGAPMMLTLGPWVPGERTTIELLPAIWVFGRNDDYLGQSLSTDPLFQIEAHVTRDFTKSAWGSLDFVWFSGAESDIAGSSAGSLNNLGVGLTFGYQVNDNLLITVGYLSTINDDGPGDFRGDEFRINFTFGWHSLIEGMKRLSGEH